MSYVLQFNYFPNYLFFNRIPSLADLPTTTPSPSPFIDNVPAKVPGTNIGKQLMRIYFNPEWPSLSIVLFTGPYI